MRHDRRVADPCPTCHGTGALLALPNGYVVAAVIVVPNQRAWRHLAVAPCVACEQMGVELMRRPRRWGVG